MFTSYIQELLNLHFAGHLLDQELLDHCYTTITPLFMKKFPGNYFIKYELKFDSEGRGKVKPILMFDDEEDITMFRLKYE